MLSPVAKQAAKKAASGTTGKAASGTTGKAAGGTTGKATSNPTSKPAGKTTDKPTDKAIHRLHLGGVGFGSRLLLGTALYPDFAVLEQSLATAKPAMATVAVRRVQQAETGVDVFSLLKKHSIAVLPNTAGCFTAQDAVLTAQLARTALETDFIKLEVIADEKTLLPDGEELLRATKQLVQEGFKVMPYTSDDPVLCRKLAEAGAVAVMPLAAPIGSGLGIRNPHNLELIKQAVKVPVIVDAGLAVASDAARVMELGLDGVLVNTAVARATDPVLMATAFRDAVTSGRQCYLAGRIPKRFYGSATSPAKN